MSTSPPCVFYAEGPDFTTVPADATATARFPRYESVSFQNSSLTAEICATIILDDIACETQESFAFNLNNNDPSVCTDMGFPPQFIVVIEDSTREWDTCVCTCMKWVFLQYHTGPGAVQAITLTLDHCTELVVGRSICLHCLCVMWLAIMSTLFAQCSTDPGTTNQLFTRTSCLAKYELTTHQCFMLH